MPRRAQRYCKPKADWQVLASGSLPGPRLYTSATQTTQIYFIDNQLRQSADRLSIQRTASESEWRWCILFIHLPATAGQNLNCFWWLMRTLLTENGLHNRNHSWIYGVGSREEERGQEKRGLGDTRSRKRWDVAEWQPIENTKQRRDKREQNGWNGQWS